MPEITLTFDTICNQYSNSDSNPRAAAKIRAYRQRLTTKTLLTVVGHGGTIVESSHTHTHLHTLTTFTWLHRHKHIHPTFASLKHLNEFVAMPPITSRQQQDQALAE